MQLELQYAAFCHNLPAAIKVRLSAFTVINNAISYVDVSVSCPTPFINVHKFSL